MSPRSFLSAIAIAATLAAPSIASAQQSMNLRGTVTAVDGDAITLSTQDAGIVAINMIQDYPLIIYTPITAEDLAPGDFLSIPALPKADGGVTALSINVFPEEMRGLGEGRSDWDFGEDSTMVNATIGTVSSVGEGKDLAVSFNGEKQAVSVPEGTSITRIAPDPIRRLEIGDKAIVAVEGDADAIKGRFAGIMSDGSVPQI